MRFPSAWWPAILAAALQTATAQAQTTTATAPASPPITVPAQPTVAAPTPAGAAADAEALDQEAHMLFEAGRLAYAAGRFEDSLTSFQRAHAISGRPVLLYNIGTAADKLRRDDVALDAFRRYLEAVPTAENRAEVEGRIRVLEQVMAATRARETTAAAPPDPARPAEAEPSQRELEIAAALRGGPTTGSSPPASGGSVLSTWWFWTIVGVVVVGGTVATVAAVSGGAAPRSFQNGSDGHVYATLGAL
jgi:tetratricopeptide (TPR) repeat protein